MKFKRFLKEETLPNMPKGFTADDIISLDDFYKESKPVKVGEAEIDDAEVTPVDVQKDIVDVKASGEERGKGMDVATKMSKLLHSNLIKAIVDENGKDIDLEKLKQQLTQRPEKLIGINGKLAKGAPNKRFYDSTLPAYQGLFFNEKANEFQVVKTCPSAGECKKFCYAAKGGYVMFPNSALNSARVITYLMNDYEGFKQQMITEVKAAAKRAEKKGKKAIIRWHDSGDFFSEKYLLLAFDVAKATPETLHYAYTKQVPMVRKMSEQKPEYFIFNFSLGGLHDDTIDTAKEKHAKVVPAALFKEFLPKRGEKPKTDENGKEIKKSGIEFSPEATAEIKKRVADHFKIDVNTIITYPEMREIPEGDTPKYNVLVWKGHGDDAAARKDVLGTYLFIH
jgi:hypothetical protein